MPELQVEVESKLRSLTTVVSAGLIFVLVFTMSMTCVIIWQSYRAGQESAKLEAVATETHDALCTFKLDLQTRYKQGLDFLKDNPAGISGFTAETIERSLRNQKATLDSLITLRCVGPVANGK